MSMSESRMESAANFPPIFAWKMVINKNLSKFLTFLGEGVNNGVIGPNMVFSSPIFTKNLFQHTSCSFNFLVFLPTGNAQC